LVQMLSSPPNASVSQLALPTSVFQVPAPPCAFAVAPASLPSQYSVVAGAGPAVLRSTAIEAASGSERRNKTKRRDFMALKRIWTGRRTYERGDIRQTSQSKTGMQLGRKVSNRLQMQFAILVPAVWARINQRSTRRLERVADGSAFGALVFRGRMRAADWRRSRKRIEEARTGVCRGREAVGSLCKLVLRET
jgi:hypothetical protein